MNHDTYIDDKVKEQVNNFGMMLLKKRLFLVAISTELFSMSAMAITGIVLLNYFIPLIGIKSIAVPYYAIVLKNGLTLLLGVAFVWSLVRYIQYTRKFIRGCLKYIEFTFITDQKIIDVDHEQYDKVLSLSAFEVYRVWKKIKKDDCPVEVKLNYNH